MSIMRRHCGTRGGVSTFIILITISIIYVLYAMDSVQRDMWLTIETGDSSYLIDTPGCRIPNVKAWSPAAVRYVFEVPRIDCGKAPLVESNDTHLRIVADALPQYGITDAQLLTCCFRPMWRNVPNVSLGADGNINNKSLADKFVYDKDIRYSSDCYTFLDSAEIHREFVRVECGVYDGRDIQPVYTDYHAFFPAVRNDETANRPNINVLFIGIDSLSRLNMIRKMPRTYTYITEALKGIPMYGYNKIGLNTFPNLMALFTGLTYDDMVKACWPHYEDHLDPCPWIWKAFSAQGYVTTYMEDSPRMSTFNLLKTGFIFQPTDFYADTLFSAADKDKPLTEMCMGPRNQIQVLLNYTYKHLKAMKRFRKRFFSFSWGVALSHDDINSVQDNDELYFNLLRNIEMEGLLNETFLVFMSDHGLRFGGFLETRQGQLENSLPALIFVIPEWFQRKYAEAVSNIRLNQHRLLTAFDVHETLFDLLDQSLLEPVKIAKRTQEKDESCFEGPSSLFLPISKKRTCEDAKVPAEFCACQHFHTTSVSDPIINNIASFIVSSINSKLLNHTDCIPHSLKRVILAECGPPLYKVENESENILEYQVSLHTEPSNALYSALVRHLTIGNFFQLVGEVSRLNAYGNQADCMPVYKLRPFCYCKTSKNST